MAAGAYGCCIISHELVSQAKPSPIGEVDRVWAWAAENQAVIHTDKLGLFTPAVERMNAMATAFKQPFLRRMCERVMKSNPKSRGCFSVSNFGAFSGQEFNELEGLKF